MKKNSVFTVKNIAKIALLSAVALVLQTFDFPLPFVAPTFYKLDFSDVAALIGGFAMGPAAGVVIEALKNVLSILFTGSTTMFVGEFANFLIGASFVLPASIMYRNKKDKHTALVGLVVGSISMAVAGVLLNYFVLIPAYSYFFHMDVDMIVAMGTAIFPIIQSKLSFVIVCVTPFNLIKGVLDSVITILLYKHISPLLHR